MRDIVQRLQCHDERCDIDIEDAVVEITRLRAEVAALKADVVAERGYRAAAEMIAKRRGEMVDALTAERDEARREVCQKHEHGYFMDEDYAEVRGWDCFRAEADANNERFRRTDGE